MMLRKLSVAACHGDDEISDDLVVDVLADMEPEEAIPLDNDNEDGTNLSSNSEKTDTDVVSFGMERDEESTDLSSACLVLSFEELGGIPV